MSFTKSIKSKLQFIDDKIKFYSVKSFNDKNIVKKYVKEFGLEKVCKQINEDKIKSKVSSKDRNVNKKELRPFDPEYDDLARLHYLILSRKIINTLEFGSGYSTVVIADAHRILKLQLNNWVLENLRTENPFHIYSVDESAKFSKIVLKRLGASLKSYVTLSSSNVKLTLFCNRYCSFYEDIPNLSPDLIYIDGPSQFATKTKMNGFTIADKSRMPMAADVIPMEFFLEPGTLIIVDGRTQNARFLKYNLKRNWVYNHDAVSDVHYFELAEPPLGKYNERKIEFCLGKNILRSYKKIKL